MYEMKSPPFQLRDSAGSTEYPLRDGRTFRVCVLAKSDTGAIVAEA